MILARGLGWRFPQGAALAFPDVALPQGGVAVLRGPSGSGKSTWLSLVAGLRRAHEGELQVAGQVLAGPAALAGTAADRWRATHLGFLPQRLHLSAALTVAGNLALAYFAAGLPRDDERIHAVLGSLGVAELAGRRPAALSGGQAQRVALARALLLRPRVLLADEPTASLDDDAAQEALALLCAQAQSSQATLVVATHDRRAHEALQRLAGQNLHQISLKPASMGQTLL